MTLLIVKDYQWDEMPLIVSLRSCGKSFVLFTPTVSWRAWVFCYDQDSSQISFSVNAEEKILAWLSEWLPWLTTLFVVGFPKTKHICLVWTSVEELAVRLWYSHSRLMPSWFHMAYTVQWRRRKYHSVLFQRVQWMAEFHPESAQLIAQLDPLSYENRFLFWTGLQ